MDSKQLTGVERIARERERQIVEKGWTPEHDDEHNNGSLAMAATCYAAPERIYVREEFATSTSFADPWPWNTRSDARPYDGNVPAGIAATKAQQIRLLEKAGALIAAEIDSLLRCKGP